MFPSVFSRTQYSENTCSFNLTDLLSSQLNQNASGRAPARLAMKMNYMLCSLALGVRPWEDLMMRIPKGRNGAKQQRSLSSPQIQKLPRSTSGELGTSASPISNAWSFSMPGMNSKRVAQLTKELDKAEATCLQMSQLKLQVEDPRQVLQVTVTKTRAALEKICSRLDEGTKTFVDLVKKEGPGCRAEQIWQQLKDGKATVESIHDFVEAIHDVEASAETLHVRAQKMKDLGVHVPRNVNSMICRRRTDGYVKLGKFDDVFKMLDYDQKESFPDGIASIVSANDSEEDRMKAIKEFQVGCVINVINGLLLAEFLGSPKKPENEQ